MGRCAALRLASAILICASVPEALEIKTQGSYTLVYDVARDACTKGRHMDNTNGPIAAFVDRAGVVNLIIANDFTEVRSYGKSILDTFAPGGGFIHNCSQNISTADPCHHGKDPKGTGCSVSEFRGQHYPFRTWAADNNDKVILYFRNNDGIGDPCCRISPKWPGHDPPGCAGPNPPLGEHGRESPLHTQCPHVNKTTKGGSGQTEHDCCKYWSILHQVSDDGGLTWSLPPTPQRVVFASPFKFQYPTVNDIADMSGIVRSRKDGLYYAFVHQSNNHNGVLSADLERRIAGNIPCRTHDPMDVTAWRCWNGKMFAIQYRDPYIYDTQPFPVTNSTHLNMSQIYQPHRDASGKPSLQIGGWMGNAVWSSTLDRFVYVGFGDNVKTSSGKATGILYQTSEDFLSWTTAELLMPWSKDGEAKAGAVRRASNAPRPSIFEADLKVAGRNFDTIGDSPWLFYQCSKGSARDVNEKYVGPHLCRIQLQVDKKVTAQYV